MSALLLASISLTLFCLFSTAPLPQEEKSFPSEETVNFMKQFGYIDAGADIDTLYTEEGFRDAVRQMQKFGGLPETGEIDNETVKLVTAPRCGVPDVIKHSNRTKRYIIGSQPWRKKNLTYFLANWPPEMDLTVVERKLKAAFAMWSDIAPLQFIPHKGMEADLIVAFGRGPHGDGYPFDGPGSILAHAFFPYEHGSYGGDLHFDDAEHWIDGSMADPYEAQEGVDFLTVATHEIGHSLGLAHSTVLGSVMFPYYKGYDRNMRMDYDDIVAMYEMYVIQGKFEYDTDTYDNSDIPAEATTEQSTNNETTETFEYYETSNVTNNDSDSESDFSTRTLNDTDDTTLPSDDASQVPYFTTERSTQDKETAVSTTTSTTSTTVATPITKKPTKRKPPNMCYEHLDAIGSIRGELFIFKDLFFWRMSDIGEIAYGGPAYFHNLFRGFPWSVRKIDAVYERLPDRNIVLFTGQNFWIFDGNAFLRDSPRPLTDLGLPSDLTHIDAAMVWDKNKKTYLFSGNMYWRFDEASGKVEDEYPQNIDRWTGVPPNLDGAITWKNGQTYFFKGSKFWRFNNQNISTDANFPLLVGPYWFDCKNVVETLTLKPLP